jgi:Fe-S-cluster-containing hydrogenase component 2
MPECAGNHAAPGGKKLKVDSKDELCSGCRTCEVICTLTHTGEVNPKKSAIHPAAEFPVPGTYHIKVCSQCGVCAEECPEGAISEKEPGVYVIDPELCTNCQVCVDACPFGVMFTHPDSPTPIKCDSCGECVAICPRAVLSMDEEV